jgi:hypothetical protein
VKEDGGDADENRARSHQRSDKDGERRHTFLLL